MNMKKNNTDKAFSKKLVSDLVYLDLDKGFIKKIFSFLLPTVKVKKDRYIVL